MPQDLIDRSKLWKYVTGKNLKELQIIYELDSRANPESCVDVKLRLEKLPIEAFDCQL